LFQGVVVQNWSFKSGQTLTITGVPNHDATNFAINIGNSPDEIALHMNPRFDAHGDNRTVVCNSFQGGSWCEEHRPDNFAFNQGEEFKIWIKFTREEFTITLPDQSEIRFPNRPGGEKYSFMNFDGEMRICSVEIK
ncbi:lectin, galactoside-binding, soluble, 2a, partial [Silurus asotus]